MTLHTRSTDYSKLELRHSHDLYAAAVCDQFDNIVISGDLNLPDILWDSIDSASGVNELTFIGTLHDHLLTQLNKKRTCGNNILDLVIISEPNSVNVTDILSPKDKGGLQTIT